MGEFLKIDSLGQLGQTKRLSSKPMVSLENIQKKEEVTKSAALKNSAELSQIKQEMQEAEYAFRLMKEIQSEIESAYQKLRPQD